MDKMDTRPRPIASERKINIQIAGLFSGIYATHFVFLGVLLPFFSGWLALRGFSAPEIGLINGVALIARLVSAPVIALYADRHHDKRRPLQWVTVVFAVSALALAFGSARALIAIASVSVIWCFGLLVPLTDSMVLRADRAGQLHYGRIRAVGSLAFLLANIAGGFLLKDNGFELVGLILAGAGIGALGVTLSLPPFAKTDTPPRDNDPAQAQEKPSAHQIWKQAGKLVSHPIFVLALLAAGFTQGAHAVYYAYSVLRWTEIGYSPEIIGWLWATGVIAEIILLTQARAVGLVASPPVMMAIGAGAALVRWLLTAAEPGLPVLFLVQMLHALTFGATYLGTVEFIDRAIPVRFVNTGMVLFSTTGVGAMTGLATVLSGYVYSAGGAGLAYSMMAIMGACSLVSALMLARLWDKGKIMS